MTGKNTVTNGRGSIEDRVIGVERDVSYLSDQVGQLATKQELHSLQLSVDRLAVAFDRAHEGSRTNWQTWLMFSSLILAIGGAALALMNSTLTDRITIAAKASENGISQAIKTSENAESLSHTRHEGQSELIRVLNDRVGALRAEYDSSNSSHTANFKEVETQLRSLSNRTNLGFETQERLISDLWQVAHKRPLSPSVVYPVIGDAPGGGN